MSHTPEFFQRMAEEKILAAIERGEFDRLPGAGKPLNLEDTGNVPEELRMAYKILKNSGHLPPEVADRKEAANIMDLLENCADEREKLRQMRRLRVLAAKIRDSFGEKPLLEQNDAYYQKILAKIGGEKEK